MSDRAGTPTVVFVTQRIAAHAAASGYDRLQEYIDGIVICPPSRWTMPQRAAVNLLRPLMKRSGSQWYHRQSLLGELEATRRWFAGSGQVFHFLYGENSHRYLGLVKNLNHRNRIVCTYHTPRERFFEVVTNRRHLARLNAAIAVSTVQLEFLADLIAADRVHFVPHGIDVGFFRPSLDSPGETEVLECIFVGSHLRDFETLARVARMLESNARVRLTLVTRPENAARFAGLRNVVVHPRVDDVGLLRIYQQAGLTVLPLLDCTANNSLLEAMACGVPVLTTDLVGVRDYVARDCAVLVPKGDAERMTGELLALENDRERLRAMRAASRRRALRFRWEVVAEMTRRVYSGAG